MEKYFAAGFGLLLGLGGLIVSFLQLRNISALNSWKITKGKVIERGTFQVTKANYGSQSYQFSPLVKYVYDIDGKEFTNDSIFPKRIQNPPRGTVQWAEKEAAKFSDEITVFYNPANPADSFLQIPSKKWFYLIGGTSFVIIFYSIFVFLFTAK